MNKANVVALLSALGPSHFSVAGIFTIFGAYCRPQLLAVLRALPNWFVRREREYFYTAVAAGKIPPAAARLVCKLKRAVLAWADEELPAAVGADKMAKALATLEQLPYIGALVAADPRAVRAELEEEYAAIRAEVAQENAAKTPPTPTPPAPPAAAAAV